MCHALGGAHAVGLVHRDIKPDNLYLAAPRREGIPFTLKILDFGIAKLTEDARASGNNTHAVGSPLWMAPEQTASGAVGPPADVWALGLVAFYCLTGRSYWRAGNYEGASVSELLREVVLDPMPPASVRAAELGVANAVSPTFDAWFAQTVARDPRERHQSASAAFTALHQALSGSMPVLFSSVALTRTDPVGTGGVSIQPVSPPPQRPSSGTAIVLAALGGLGLLGAIAVLAVAAGYWYLTSSSAEPTPAATVEATADASVAATPVASAASEASTDAAGPSSPTQSAQTSGASSSSKTPAAGKTAEPAKTSEPAKVSGVPAGWRPRNVKCVVGKDACYVNCCQKGELLSPWPECACYWKPPATSKPPGAKPRGVTCVKGADFCSVNCCKPGEFLAPFPECACYFLPPSMLDGGS
jgi:serine/threonine-protein kinase